ncbi:Hypothetical protein, putative [Bodo saltans]|uniref:Uncharacterized protein n=1 Tax=Bodo saltans TaxID=75058 RepID=A0A0S4IYF0_BODSA|nr:Hypothetical protein, putative [Bodo saltans]|eukprot:CUF73699.1 Hypothetical protein, putative [Bodo saltans]
MEANHNQALSPVAAAVLAPMMTYRHNPYDRHNPKVIIEENVRGVMPYNECELKPATPFVGETTDLIAGCVPHGMKPARLRWVVEKVTGVTPLAVREGRKTSDGRRPTGVFFLTVRTDDAERVLQKSGCALCLPNWLWAPQSGLYDVASVSKELKCHGDSRVNALTFAQATSTRPKHH